MWESFSSQPLAAECLLASEFLAWRQELKSLGGDSGALDWLLDAAAGLSQPRLQMLHLDPGRLVELSCRRDVLENLWQQHLSASIPVQHLVGRCSWRHFEIAVGPGVLIPRPETELMIDLSLAWMEARKREADGPSSTPLPTPPFLWADLGTGSGCLAMGLSEAFPTSWGFAVDISAPALRQARSNLQAAGLAGRVQCIQGDWLRALQPWWGQLQLLLSNPPYIPTGEIERLDPVVRDHEPHLALDGGNDGLSAIRQLAQQAPRALTPGGLLLLEHHHDQSDQVLALLAQHGLIDGQSHQDLEGNRRFASARKP